VKQTVELEKRVLEMRRRAPESMDIPGYGGKYYVRQDGTVWRRGKTKDCRLAGHRKGRNRDVHLSGDNKKTRCTAMSAIMRATYFSGLVPDGYVLMHVNGMESDWSIYNLKPISQSDLGKLRNRSNNARSVEKVVPETMKSVMIYKSAREAARNNYLSYQTVLDACNKKNKKMPGVAPDGFMYKWMD